MRLLLVVVLLCWSAYAQFTNKMQDSSINMRTNFDKFAKKCNVYDEASYCQQIVIDQRLNLAAVSYRCECPDGWRCPSHITDTIAYSECQFDESKYWHRCQLRCTPLETEGHP
ncbi:hypothetical protein Y032_0034g2823 [Ancylostoma ceylanicum]|uniref:EGF-like domain-containing protein n=1 Tax=Ancylostoma ceylanicum TaxID=53326 RepID=A0A016UL90_9BILA|nr:hypothetical protein Y032_0034g2823 [Ancylostoma ceylanicum]